MRNKHFLLIILLVAPTVFYSCKGPIKGEGSKQAEKREVSGFTEIELSIPARVTVVMADSFNCIITAQPNVINAVETKVKRDALRIESDYSFQDPDIEIVISLPAAERLLINGSGSIKTINIIKSKNLNLYLNGSGEMFINAETLEMRTEINGSGACFLKGASKFHRCEINGSGNFHGFDFLSQKTDVEINGSGDAEITATEDLEVTVHGSGTVMYKDSPHIKSDIVGSGTLIKNK